MDAATAVSELVYLVSSSDPFTGTNPLYSAVTFRAEYPLGEMSVPIVAFSLAGGPRGQRRGLGSYATVAHTDVQMDVLANTALEATRIFNKVRHAIFADYQDNDDSGSVGKGYLRGKLIRRVWVGQPRSASWDETERVRRVLAYVTLEYLEA